MRKNKMKMKMKELDLMTIPELTAYYNTLPKIPMKLKKFKSKTVAMERIKKHFETLPKKKTSVSISKGKRGPKTKFTGDIIILNERPRLNRSEKHKIKYDTFQLLLKYKNIEKIYEHSEHTQEQTRFAIYAFVSNGTIKIAD